LEEKGMQLKMEQLSELGVKSCCGYRTGIVQRTAPLEDGWTTSEED
jgi:hypothetical protein